jgi:pimeloyl-ACP methyl ester carboxylesterase
MTAIKYRSADVDGLEVFYREAGSTDMPALLLLHGFPSASHMFRDLIPLLADRFRTIAPDFQASASRRCLRGTSSLTHSIILPASLIASRKWLA